MEGKEHRCWGPTDSRSRACTRLVASLRHIYPHCKMGVTVPPAKGISKIEWNNVCQALSHVWLRAHSYWYYWMSNGWALWECGRELQKGNRPEKLILSFTSLWTEQVAATPLWDFRTLKIGVMVIWKGAPLDILGVSSFCNLEDAHRFGSNSWTFSQYSLLKCYVVWFPLRLFCSEKKQLFQFRVP